MKLAIMQPYLFPYLGYFQLIRAVDTFVVYDDVNFIKSGWVNRNYILANGNKQLLTLPLQGASQNKRINQINISKQHKILKSLRQNYIKAPNFDCVYSIIEDIFDHTDDNLAGFLDYQLRRICEYLCLAPHWKISSSIVKDNDLRGQDKILSISEILGATHYINVPGGRALYDSQSFVSRGLQLSFIQQRAVNYKQFGAEFVSGLSIIDVMMFNDKAQCARLLQEFDLV
jgi:hypothetical protein